MPAAAASAAPTPPPARSQHRNHLDLLLVSVSQHHFVHHHHPSDHHFAPLPPKCALTRVQHIRNNTYEFSPSAPQSRLGSHRVCAYNTQQHTNPCMRNTRNRLQTHNPPAKSQEKKSQTLNVRARIHQNDCAAGGGDGGGAFFAPFGVFFVQLFKPPFFQQQASFRAFVLVSCACACARALRARVCAHKEKQATLLMLLPAPSRHCPFGGDRRLCLRL